MPPRIRQSINPHIHMDKSVCLLVFVRAHTNHIHNRLSIDHFWDRLLFVRTHDFHVPSPIKNFLSHHHTFSSYWKISANALFKGPRRPTPEAEVQKRASQNREVMVRSTPKPQLSLNTLMDFTAQVKSTNK